MAEHDLMEELQANGLRPVTEPWIWRPPVMPELIWSRPTPEKTWIKGPKFSIPFYTVSCEKFTKSSLELKAYDSPITKILEENSVKDITLSEDKKFLAMMEGLLK